MGKFTDRFRPRPQPQLPPAPPIPEGQTTEKNGTYINEQQRCFQVHIYDTGKQDDLALAIGTLDFAKDIIKQQMSQWHLRDKQKSTIIIPQIVPKGNGHVQ